MAAAKNQNPTERRRRVESSYMEGNAVRKIQERPRRKKSVRTTQKERKAYQNRKKAMRTSPGYVFFLTIASVLALFICVNYISIRTQVINQNKINARLVSQISNLKLENDALYNKAIASTNLEVIKNKAMNRLGMRYPLENQVEWFEVNSSSYFRQYQELPENK